MQQFPEKAERIGLAMDDGSRRSMKQIINRYYCPSSGLTYPVYPWASLGEATIIDVGGGIGAVSLALLNEFPQLKSIVQERPEAVTNGRNVRSALAIKR